MELRKNTSSCHPLHRGFPLGKHSMKYVLAAFLLAGPAAAEAQNLQQAITLQVNNTSLAVVLKQISQASGYKINFNTEDLQGLTATLNTGGKKMTVADILNRLSADLPIRYRMEKDFITVSRKDRPQPEQAREKRRVSGYVFDESNEPLPGVSVRVEGEEGGNITSVDGKYLIAVPSEGATLIVSYIGMETQRVHIAAGTTDVTRNIVLKNDAEKLSEVVVTGIFNSTRESYTGAASTFTHKQLSESGNRSLISTLRNLDPPVNIIGLTVSEGMIRKILREKDSKWEYLGQMNDEIVVTYFEIIRFLGMFRLGQQIRGHITGIGGFVGDDEDLAGPGDGVDAHKAVDRFFRQGHKNVAGSHDLVHFRDARRSESQRGHCLRSTHFVDPVRSRDPGGRQSTRIYLSVFSRWSDHDHF